MKSKRSEVLEAFGAVAEVKAAIPAGVAGADSQHDVGRPGDLPADDGSGGAWVARCDFTAMVGGVHVEFHRGDRITGAAGQYLAATGAQVTPTVLTKGR